MAVPGTVGNFLKSNHQPLPSGSWFSWGAKPQPGEVQVGRGGAGLPKAGAPQGKEGGSPEELVTGRDPQVVPRGGSAAETSCSPGGSGIRPTRVSVLQQLGN